MKQFTKQFSLLLTFFAIAIFSAKAESYTLTDDDVVMEDGVILSCSYGFAIKSIIIPKKLDGQDVIGIDDESGFRYMRIEEIVFPGTLQFIDDLAFKESKLTRIDLTNCNNLIYIGEKAFNSATEGFELPVCETEGFIRWQDTDGNVYQAGDVVLSLSSSYQAKVPYTLTDDDVVVIDGLISDFTLFFKSKFIAIPDTLDGQAIVGIYPSKSIQESRIVEITLPSTIKSIAAEVLLF